MRISALSIPRQLFPTLNEFLWDQNYANGLSYTRELTHTLYCLCLLCCCVWSTKHKTLILVVEAQVSGPEQTRPDRIFQTARTRLHKSRSDKIDPRAAKLMPVSRGLGQERSIVVGALEITHQNTTSEWSKRESRAGLLRNTASEYPPQFKSLIIVETKHQWG